MEEKLSGIVLNSVEYGENDKILNIFTLEKGTVSARIKGVKKAGAKLKFASQPFCFAEYVFSVSGEKRTVIGASLIDSFYPVRESIERYFAGGTVLEFAKKFLKEEIVSKEMFFLITESLKQLAYNDGEPFSVTARFLINGLELSGFALNLSGCNKCDSEIGARAFFDAGSGGFICEKCFDGVGREINSSTYFALKDIFNGKTPPKEFCVKGLKLLEYYINFKTEEKLKSLNELIKL